MAGTRVFRSRCLFFLALCLTLVKSLMCLGGEMLGADQALLGAVKLQMKKFERPMENLDYWTPALTQAELKEVVGASENLGMALGRIVERRLDSGAKVSKEMLKVIVDFIFVSGFWDPAFKGALDGTHLLAKIEAIRDCLAYGGTSTFFYFLSSLLGDDPLVVAAKAGVKGPSFLDSIDGALARLSEQETLILGSSEAVRLELDQFEAILPGKTEIENRDGKSFHLKRVFQEKTIAEAAFEFSSSEVINGVDMKVAPEFRRSGISLYFGAMVRRHFPDLARIETYLGLKNFEVFQRGLMPAASNPSIVLAAILNSPAGRIAVALGFGSVETYEVRKNDVYVVFVRSQSASACSDLLLRRSFGS